MCGRTTLILTPEKIIKELFIDEWDNSDTFLPRYNISPGQYNPVLIWNRKNRIIKEMKWGLEPSWSKDKLMGKKLFNARSETLLEKPSFQDLVSKKRCVVIADGYFEWQKSRKFKKPHYIFNPNGKLLPMAGLWSSKTSLSGKSISSYTIITTTPTQKVSQIHNRMPVILHTENLDTWLNFEKNSISLALSVLKSSKIDLDYYPVSEKVNNAGFDKPQCIRRANYNETLNLFSV